FAPADVCWAALRLIVAVPMGYAFAALAKDAVGPVVGFALGAFPLTRIMEFLRNWFSKVTGQTTASNTARSDSTTGLQGVDDDVAIRLANEGITTIPQIADCDPVRLVMRSSFTFKFVTDCMNQAISWRYFEIQLAELRPLGLRGAVEMSHFI